MAEQSRNVKSQVAPFVIATVLASSMMFFRVLFWVFSFNQQLMWKILIPILAMGLTSAAVIGILILQGYRKNATLADPTEEVLLESPFQVAPALKFALFFLMITILSEVASNYLGAQGTYIVSFVAGFADVDAITVTLSNQALHSQIALDVAAKGVIVAMIMNTTVKLFIAKMFGGKKFGNAVLAAFAAILAAGGISLFFI